MRRRASAGPATSLTRVSELRGPGQGGHESASSEVDALQAYGQGDFIDADEGGSSRVDTLQAYGRGSLQASVVRKLALSYFNPAVQLYIDDVSNDEMHVRCN